MTQDDERLARIEAVVARVEAKLDALIEALAEEDPDGDPSLSLDSEALTQDRDPLSPL